MYRTEMEIQTHRADMEREAANQRLVQIARGDQDQPNLWARLRARMVAIEQQPSTPPVQKKVATT